MLSKWEPEGPVVVEQGSRGWISFSKKGEECQMCTYRFERLARYLRAIWA